MWREVTLVTRTGSATKTVWTTVLLRPDLFVRIVGDSRWWRVTGTRGPVDAPPAGVPTFTRWPKDRTGPMAQRTTGTWLRRVEGLPHG